MRMICSHASGSPMSLPDFICRFSDIRNTIPDMIEDWVIVAFKQGYKDERTAVKIGHQKPKNSG